MPNWCSNTLEVVGSPADVDAFIEATTVDGRVLSFERLVPVPQSVLDRESTEELLDWRWSMDGWGTKWDVNPDSCQVLHESGSVVWMFETPWGPPSPWLSKVAAMWPRLTFRLGYDEPGACFCGVQKYADGELDPSGTWQLDRSLDMLWCRVPDCEGFASSEVPHVMDFDEAPGDSVFEVFCADHALAEAVCRQRLQDSEPSR